MHSSVEEESKQITDSTEKLRLVREARMGLLKMASEFCTEMCSFRLQRVRTL